MIAVIDYGVGNLGSIINMFKKIGMVETMSATTPDDLKKADKYILPGVGAFDVGIKLLNHSGMREELDRQILELHKPILGICLGMQMLGEMSEEGVEMGLGYIPFSCRKFQLDGMGLRVPHMGWDYVHTEKDISLAARPKENLRFYFAHSYYAECSDVDDILFSCDYGLHFAAGIHRDNIYGVQFHPEKSHNFGKWLFQNFVEEV